MLVSVLFAGVGGQGVVTASDLLAHCALGAGWDVKKAETHGMAQRGGSVVSHVRLADRGSVRSPLIPEGQADYLVAMELLEGLRALSMLKPDGKAIVDVRTIMPITVASGQRQYPEGLEERLRERGLVIEATAEATRLGEPRAANSVLLGVLSCFLPLAEEAWRQAFEGGFKPKALEVNWQAFLLGRTLAVARGK